MEVTVEVTTEDWLLVLVVSCFAVLLVSWSDDVLFLADEM